MKDARTWTPASSLSPWLEGKLVPAPFRPVQDIGSLAVNWDKFRDDTAAATLLPMVPLGTFIDFIWKDLEHIDNL